MIKELFFCQGCEEIVDELFYDNTNNGLCKECENKYDNKTGHCSLDCCLGLGCDESC